MVTEERAHAKSHHGEALLHQVTSGDEKELMWGRAGRNGKHHFKKFRFYWVNNEVIIRGAAI